MARSNTKIRLKKLGTLFAITALTGATIVPGVSAATPGGAGDRPAPWPDSSLYNNVPEQTSISCQHLFGSQYICQAKMPWGSVDFHCDTTAGVCKRV